MRNKLIVFFLLIVSNSFAQSSAGLFIGYNFQTSVNDAMVLNYQMGYQQSFLNKIVLAANFGYLINGEDVYNGNYKSNVVMDGNVKIRYDFIINDYKYYGLESKYFFNELDESPLGTYISSNYKLTSLGLFSRVNGVYDQNDRDISNNYDKVRINEAYYSEYYINSFGLKLGASSGHGFNIYVGADYNIPMVTKDSRISINMSPNYNNLTYSFGLLFGVGLGY